MLCGGLCSTANANEMGSTSFAPTQGVPCTVCVCVVCSKLFMLLFCLCCCCVFVVVAVCVCVFWPVRASQCMLTF